METQQPKGDELIDQLNKNFASLITTSLGVTAALSFNDAIKSMFEKGGVFAKVGKRGVWYTACAITFLAFVATFFFTRKYPNSSPTVRPNPIQLDVPEKTRPT
jgi:hypothetical protein